MNGYQWGKRRQRELLRRVGYLDDILTEDSPGMPPELRALLAEWREAAVREATAIRESLGLSAPRDRDRTRS